MHLHFYQNKSGKNLILEYINSLPINEQVDGYSVLRNLEQNQWDRIKYKSWEKQIYEIYFYKHNRIFYVISDKDNIYLLHSCKKQKNKTEKKDANIVRKRAKEIGNILGKKFIWKELEYAFYWD